MFRNKYAWILPCFWAILLLSVSSLPNFSTDSLAISMSDKLWHIFAYLPLGFLLFYAIQEKPGPFASAPMRWAMILGLFYAVFDEAHQHFIPGRQLDVLDLLANIVGVVLGIFVFLVQRQIYLRYRESGS